MSTMESGLKTAPVGTTKVQETVAEAREEAPVICKAEPGRMYSSSALHAAKHFFFAKSEAGVLALADEFQRMGDLTAVAIVDSASGKTLGIVRRERLFALLGKPFGREVLMKSRVSEIVEEAPAFDAHEDLFAVAERMLPDGGDYSLLVGPDGRFLGLLASQDLANYLSQMTQEDIKLAGRIQERLMRPESSDQADSTVGSSARGFEAWSRPAKGVGGDFYFSKKLPDGRIFLTLCDVSGKGVAASLIVSMVWGMLSMFDFSRGLRELIVGLNESIVATFHMEKYLTGVFLVYDPERRRLLMADMGHSHAVLFRGGRPRSLKGPQGNLPIGVETELEPAIYPYKLEEGDDLFVYSDGLVEQEDHEGREYGERRLILTAAAALANGGARGGAQDGARGGRLRDVLPKAIDAHRGAVPQQDDMSFIVLSV